MVSKISLLVSKNSTPSSPQRFNPTDRTESVSDASRQKGVILEFSLSLSFSVDRLSDFGCSTRKKGYEAVDAVGSTLSLEKLGLSRSEH